MGNTQGKAQLTPALPLWRGREGNALLSSLTGKKVSTHLRASPCQSKPSPFCDTEKVAEDGCPDRAAALSSLNTSWFSEIIYRSVVVKKRLLEAEGAAEPAHPYQSLCD